jgi:hypothetical protein
VLDYWRRPAWRDIWAFNGQAFRRRVFADLNATVGFAAIVETGTSFGTTTRYFRQTTRGPIHSFETNPRRYGYARTHLKGCPALYLYRCDSRTGLHRLAASGALPSGPVFFYFDAHGGGDLPVAEEIALAFRHWSGGVVMIDDFCVPDDPGYGFDDYGAGGTLNLEYLDGHGVLSSGVWFPRCVSGDETGARRGCVVLASATDVIDRIDALPTLRRWGHCGPHGGRSSLGPTLAAP